MSIHAYLMKHYPVRRSDDEKQRFRAWVTGFASREGYEARTETTSRGKHQNVVIGDPEHAAVVFTAHYDTASNMLFPNLLMPRNPLLYILYQLLLVAALLAPCALLGALVMRLSGSDMAARLCFLLPYFALLCLIGFGPSNRHNANDNTSGVAAVLETMRRIPEQARPLAAFILFDNEEKGCLGSRQYAKDHPQQQFMRLVVNLDCVGCGKDVIVIARDMARRCTGYRLLERTLAETPGCNAHFFASRGCIFSSDQRNFKCGVGVCACRRAPVAGFITTRGHTRRDTQCDEGNLDYLATAFSDFASRLSPPEDAQ